MDVLRDWIKDLSIFYVVPSLAVPNHQLFSLPCNANVSNQAAARDLANALSNVSKLSGGHFRIHPSLALWYGTFLQANFPHRDPESFVSGNKPNIDYFKNN